jgi:hypothetical protein
MNGFIYFWGLRNSLIDWISDANWLELDWWLDWLGI